MSKFDYETFQKKIDENNAIALDSEDDAGYYAELHQRKEQERASLKAQLNDLQKNNKELKRKYELCDALNKELVQTRESMDQANAVLCEGILKVKESRRELLVKHVDAMEQLEEKYVDFAKVRSDSDSLKTKLAELKAKKSALQEEYNNMSEELQRITVSMNDLNIPLPDADVVKRISEEILVECGDLSVKKQKLEKMKLFLKDFQEKINSN